MPLMPDKNAAQKLQFLSPTILALYNDTNSIANLPNVS